MDDLAIYSGHTDNKDPQEMEEFKGAIETSGFLFEVRVARVLRELGYLVTPNSPIPHPEQRSDLIEIDVEASDQEFIRGGSFGSFTGSSLLIECKRNSQPIAFFMQPEKFPEVNANLAACCTSVFDRNSLLEFMCAEKWHHYGHAPEVASQLCSFVRKGGKLMAEPCSTYRESLNRLCLATAARALRLNGRADDEDSPIGFIIELIYPILVTGGPLLSVSIGADQVRLSPQEHIAVHRGARVDGTLHEFQIDVVTEAALPTLLATIRSEADFLVEWAKRHTRDLVPRVRKKRQGHPDIPKKNSNGDARTSSARKK